MLLNHLRQVLKTDSRTAEVLNTNYDQNPYGVRSKGYAFRQILQVVFVCLRVRTTYLDHGYLENNGKSF